MRLLAAAAVLALSLSGVAVAVPPPQAPADDTLQPLEVLADVGCPAKFVVALCADRAGDVWVGTEDDGVYRRDPAGHWTRFTTKDGLGDDNGYALACDGQGRVWAGHLNHGVSVFDGTRWQNYEPAAGLSRPDSRAGPLGERAFKIAVSPKSGDVWIATNVGLTRYAPSTRLLMYGATTPGSTA